MRYRDEAPQQETQEQSTEELGENILLMKMAAGPHTVRSGSPKKVNFFFLSCIKAVYPAVITATFRER